MTWNPFGRAVVCSAASMIMLLNVATPTLAASNDCGAAIKRVQAELDAALDKRAGAGRTAKQSPAATMRRQPTPETVARAEAEIGDWEGGTRAVSALSDARSAMARGDQQACVEAVNRAQDIIRE